MRLFVFGLGYTSLALARGHRARFSHVAGTVRSWDKAEALRREGITARVFSEDETDPHVAEDLAACEALLVSVPPNAGGDPVLAAFGKALEQAHGLSWIGYLSTLGVYGDHGGAWIDEATPLRPGSARAKARLKAEEAWLSHGARMDRPVHVFRLGGIYGPGRNALAQLAEGTARRVVKPGQVFNRIHVEDIAAALLASMAHPRAGAIYNLADDEPAPPQDVVAHAARLAGIAPPPEIPFARADLSPMARGFYEENKRASNRLLKEELGVALRHPTYREGLQALRAAGEGP